jgi:hypothetical protein
LPAENYKFFGDLLSSSIRDQAASCVEAAFDSLPLADADKMLFFDAATQKAERTAYVEQRGATKGARVHLSVVIRRAFTLRFF